MKRCAKCDRQYDDAYDACPHCAKEAPSRRTSTVFLVLFGLGVIIWLLGYWPAGVTLILVGILGRFWIGIVGFFRGIGDGYRDRSDQ